MEYEQPGVDPTLVGTTMWRPKKKPGHKKGSGAAKKAADTRWKKPEDSAESVTTEQAELPTMEARTHAE